MVTGRLPPEVSSHSNNKRLGGGSKFRRVSLVLGRSVFDNGNHSTQYAGARLEPIWTPISKRSVVLVLLGIRDTKSDYITALRRWHRHDHMHRCLWGRLRS